MTLHEHNTVIVGAGAAGVNCAVHLYEFMSRKGVRDPEKRIVIVTGGLRLGASRMSGSDKQTYYKMGTSPDVADSAEEFAKSLTAAGCAHGDHALIEGIGSLREFYHLVQAGVPFPHDPAGSYVGYKTDHDPYQRATSAGPKTSKFMSECLQSQAEAYGIEIHDHREIAELLVFGEGGGRRIVGVAAVDNRCSADSAPAVSVYLCENLVLAAGGPGELYKTTVYPRGQFGIHGLAFKAGLAGQNLTESQFGLASTKFRWNVSGTYMQAVPRLFSTDADGGGERDFLAGCFPTMSKMATAIFLKGYQWPFDPQRIEDCGSSLIDVLVFNETQKGRRVFMDFLRNPVGSDAMAPFALDNLEDEAQKYLRGAGALQATPIERLAHMNPLAIDVYKKNGIDLHTEPLEIAVCAQHNNGGFAVNGWWESSIPHTFVIGEMAGTHGVKRPGGSALNAGQVGGLRAAEYIANCYGGWPEAGPWCDAVEQQTQALFARFEQFRRSEDGLDPGAVIEEIQERMTASGGHIREIGDAKGALDAAAALWRAIQEKGFAAARPRDLIAAVRAEHMALTSAAYLSAIVSLLDQGGGSRGSHLVVADDGVEIHPDVLDGKTGRPLRFKPENEELRSAALQVRYDSEA
ncbi:MAG: FAD-binding protein, partial [Planctomycetota bacterium]